MPNIPVVVERIFDSEIDDVWKAFTDADRMKLWCFDMPDFKPEVGCKFSFLGGRDPEKPYVHLCEVLEVVPHRLLSYTWSYQGLKGVSTVIVRLTELDDQTLVRLEHHGLFSFPSDEADLAMGNFVEGWNHIINTSLEEYLEKYS